MLRGQRIHSWRAFALATLCCISLAVAAGGVSGAQAAGAIPHSSVTTTPTRPTARPLPRALDDATSQQTLAASPGKFPFQTATSSDGRIIVHFYSQASGFGQQVIAQAQSALSGTIPNTLGFQLLRPANIYIYASRADFLAGAPVTDADETGALTVFSTSTVYLEYGSDNTAALMDDLPHELTHVVFHQNEESAAIASFFSFFPRWLDEGLAASDETVDTYASTLNQAVQKRALVDILKVFNNDYPADPDVDYLAYAESRAFILYLEHTFGADTLHLFLHDIRDGNLNLAAERRFGASLATLEGRWENILGALPPGVNVGYLPATPSAIAYAPGNLPATATTLAPFWVSAAGALPNGWLALLLGLFLAGLAILVDEWSLPKRRAPANIIAFPSASPNSPSTLSTADSARADTEAQTSSATASTAVAVAEPPQPMPRRSPEASWYDALLLLAPLPVAVTAGLLAVHFNPLHEWRVGYLIALCVALPFLILALAITLLRRRADGWPALRMIALGGAALLSILALTGMAPSAKLQASAYETRGAYALALRYYADTAEPDAQRAADLARIHREWAAAASAVHDLQTATLQLRAALALDGASAKAADQAALLTSLEGWGARLQASGSFAAAIQAYDDEATQPDCAAACHAQMHADAAAATLAWGDALYLQGNLDAAHDTYNEVLHNYAGTSAAGIAQKGYAETGGQLALSAALAAGDRGDYTSMNAQLRALAQTYPNTLALQDAQSAPEPVTGAIRDVSGASVAGDRLFLLGFTTYAAASGFSFNFTTDPSVVKVATTLRGDGSFTARLTPGLWYIACWDDPSQSAYSDFNEPDTYGNDAFTVTRYTPASVGVIVGF